jgi:hypothetical protein
MSSRTWTVLGTAALVAAACSPKPSQEATAAAPTQSAAAPEAAAIATPVDTSATPPAPASSRPGCANNFASFDSNADQRVSLEEFLARPHANPDPSAVFSARDSDGDGALTNAEFCSGSGPGAAPPGCRGAGAGGCPGMAASGGHGHGPGSGMGHGGGPRCEGNFTRFDANGDGKVSEQEFLALPHAQSDPRAIFTARDQNNDGQLIQAEFCAPWSKAGQATSAATP